LQSDPVGLHELKAWQSGGIHVRTLEVDMAPIWAAALSAFPRSHIIQVLEFLLILRKSTDA